MSPLRETPARSPEQELAMLIIDSMTGTRIAARGYLTSWLNLQEMAPGLQGLESYHDLLVRAAQMIDHWTWQLEVLKQMVGSKYGVRTEYVAQQEKVLALLQTRLDHLMNNPHNAA